MRVLLLNTKTGLYFDSSNSWTANAQAAKDFQDSRQAAVYAQEIHQDDVQIFLDFGDDEYNVSLPVEDRLEYP